MSHIVMIKSKNPDKFNYCKFGTYTDSEGRIKELVDINGKTVNGYEMFQAVVTLDIDKEYDNRLYTFLEDHPLIKGKFIIEDVSTKEKQTAEKSIKSAEAITMAAELKVEQIKELGLLLGYDLSQEEMLLRARIIELASTNADKFLTYVNDMDKEHRVFLVKARKNKVLNKVNGVWKHNTLNIGLTDDQAIMWLKDNGDTYALLKQELRGGKVRKTEEKPVELIKETEEHSMRAGSAISQIEQEIENIQNNK